MGSTNPRVIVVGSGFGGLEAAFYLRKRLGKKADVTVVSETPQFLFKPNTIYIPFGKPPEELVFELESVFDKRSITYARASAEAVNPIAKKLLTTAGELAYDYLVIATGAAMRPAEIPGLEQHANTIWTPSEMSRLGASLSTLLESVRAAGARKRVVFLVPPNNKCAGPLYEMVMMLDTWLRRRDVRGSFDIKYATCERGYIQAFGPRLHDVVASEFAARGITGALETVVTAIERGVVHYQNGASDAFDLLVSFPPYVAAQRFESLSSDDRGFLKTLHDSRQVVDSPEIYAVGDAGDYPVKQAFLALLQADTAAEHIAERILGEEPRAAFDPVSMCIMEQFDKATFAQVPLRETGDPELPVAVREDALELYRVGSGTLWRIGKKLLGAAIPGSFRAGRPFHAGPSWATMEAGLNVMKAAFTD